MHGGRPLAARLRDPRGSGLPRPDQRPRRLRRRARSERSGGGGWMARRGPTGFQRRGRQLLSEPARQGGSVMAIRLTKIYTRGGDKGMTALVGGVRVPKESGRLEAYGTIDELNSVIGIV